MPLSILPTRPDGRICWRKFYEDVRPGQKFILPADLQGRVGASRRDCRYKIKASLNRDRQTMTLTILPPRSERAAMLAAFHTLTNVQLRAVVSACQTLGILPS